MRRCEDDGCRMQDTRCRMQGSGIKYQVSGTGSLVSIVVTTKNEEKHIENCLKSIKLQTYPDIEIIVVDNNSIDKTKKIAKKYTNLVFNKGPERSAQRNFGMMKVAKGKYVMYVDADMILSPTLIEDCVYEMKNNEDLTALYIPEIVLGNNFWSKVRRFERRFYDGTTIDCVRFIRKDIFIKIGGFDLSMTGPEDWDLDKKIRQIGKVKVLTQELRDAENSDSVASWAKEFSDFLKDKSIKWLNYGSVIYHNEAEFNLKRYLQKKAYYARSFDIYIKKWGLDDPDIKKQFGIWYRFFGVFIENGKWKKMIKHPILTMGMYWLRFMVGVMYLMSKARS
ncbi:MAG: glycosyltransferase [Candidatus Desulfofervidaceae bacterium]|nr:glycosyltransferase [Candidatus Desulfofervidaceae bacterium]